MRTSVKTSMTYLTIFALVAWLSPVSVLAAESGGRLEGLILGVDGKPATGSTVYIVDPQGASLQATADDNGIYSFRDLPAGEYAVGIALADGTVAPVSAPPVQLGTGELARRDVKLVQADTQAVQSAAAANYSFGTWWAGLSGGAKAGVVIGFLVVGYGLFEAFDDDDDETPATEFNPG